MTRPIATISEQALAQVVDEWPPESQPFSRMWTAMAALDILTDGLSEDDLDDIYLLGGVMPDIFSKERDRYAWWAKHTSTVDNPRAELELALSTTGNNATDFAGQMGRACHLPTAGPIMFYILKNSGSYREAVEHNILAGGDSAGRSILIGAIMARVHRVATPTGIPLSWLLQLDDTHRIWMECDDFSK